MFENLIPFDSTNYPASAVVAQSDKEGFYVKP